MGSLPVRRPAIADATAIDIGFSDGAFAAEI
jgi:hypothetical protein